MLMRFEIEGTSKSARPLLTLKLHFKWDHEKGLLWRPALIDIKQHQVSLRTRSNIHLLSMPDNPWCVRGVSSPRERRHTSFPSPYWSKAASRCASRWQFPWPPQQPPSPVRSERLYERRYRGGFTPETAAWCYFHCREREWKTLGGGGQT